MMKIWLGYLASLSSHFLIAAYIAKIMVGLDALDYTFILQEYYYFF